jgi:hypothetical protein
VRLHQAARLADLRARADGDGIDDHARDGPLDLVHLARLVLRRHVLVDDADAALVGERDRERRLGHGVHRRGGHGDRHGDVLREARLHVDVRRDDLRPAGQEQDVVERDPLAGDPVVHGRLLPPGWENEDPCLGDFDAPSREIPRC